MRTLADVPRTPTEAELTIARERFAVGRRLEDAGQWAEALDIFERVGGVKQTPQVRFHIALCLENIGLWSRALDGYARAATEAAGIAPEVVKEAKEHLRKLEATMPTVSLRIRGAVAGDELFLDGHRLPVDAEPLPMRADPGPHRAEVKRNGEVVARGYFALDPQGTRWIELSVGTIATDGTGPPDDAPRRPAPQAKSSTQRSLGWIGIAAGASAAIATGVFIGLRQDALSRVEAECPRLTGCSPSVAPIVRDGTTDAALVNVFAATASAAAIGGAVLVLSAPARGAHQTWSATLQATPLGILLRGVF